MGNAAALSSTDSAAIGAGAEDKPGASKPSDQGGGGGLFDKACCNQCDKADGSVRADLAPGAAIPEADQASVDRGVNGVDKSRYYREWDAIKGALVGGDTLLIRGTFLEHLHNSSSFLPRWQDLPPSAAWKAEE